MERSAYPTNVAIPATYVVGQDGRILARYVDPDFRNRMDVEDIIASLLPTRHGVSWPTRISIGGQTFEPFIGDHVRSSGQTSQHRRWLVRAHA